MTKYHPAVEFIKRHAYILLGGLCLFVIGIIYIVGRGSEPEIVRTGDTIFDADAYENEYTPPPEPTPEAEDIPPEPVYIVVHVTGAVNSPGVFTLREGSRVSHAVEMAGGMRDDADELRINMAAALRDEMQIIVPTMDDEIENVFVFGGDTSSAQGNTQGNQNQSGGLININTATSIELQTLSGVGPAVAQRIIDFREAHGNFASVDELTHVSGIGPATLERLRPLITVD